MLARYYVEIKYGLITIALLEALIALDRMQAFRGLDTAMNNLLELMTSLGFVGIFLVGLIANASVLLNVPYTVPLLSMAMSGASLEYLLLMSVASGLGATCGEVFSYTITLKLLGGNVALEKSSLLQWVKRVLTSRPRTAPIFLFIWAASPLPDDTVIIPLALVRYGVKRIVLPLLFGKLVHNAVVVIIFYYFTGWAANRMTVGVQVDLALGILILFVMVILYQVEKSGGMKQILTAELSQ